MSPALSIVPDRPGPAKETVAQRVRALQGEARRLAKDHIGAFAAAMADLQAMADEINRGGDAYPEGARAVAREVAMHCESRGQILETLNGRS